MTVEFNGMPTRFTLINGLRGIAVLLVLGFHFNVPLFEHGYWGVDLFFWISGFLITGGFLREYSKNREGNQKFGWIDIKFYFIKRIRRILPLSLIVLLSVIAVVYFSGDSAALSQTVRRIPRILSFTFNMQLQSDAENYFLMSDRDFGLLHYWSLSVEEQIYVLSPIVFLVAVSFHGLKLFGFRIKWYLRVFLLNLVFSLGSFTLMVIQNQDNRIENYYSTFSRFWQFGLGSMVAVLWQIDLAKRLPIQIRVYLTQLSSMVMILSIPFLKNEGFGPLVLIPLLSVSIFVLINLGKRQKGVLSSILHLRLIQFFGDIAFPLYLVHWPAMILLRSAPDRSSLLNILLYLTAITLISYLLHAYVEKPLLAIDLSRFKSNALSRNSIMHPRSLKRAKRLSVASFLSITLLLAVLSYPNASSVALRQVSTFFGENRYGVAAPKISESETILSGQENDSKQSSEPSGVIEETLRPSNEPQAQRNSKELETPASTKARPPLPRLNENWFNAVSSATKTYEMKKSVFLHSKALSEELRRSWFIGCLDSKSAEQACTLGNGEVKEAVLLGDSFSYALRDAFQKSLPVGWKLRILTKGSCLPWNVVQYNKNGTVKTDCSSHANWVNEYISNSRPDLVIASGADQWFEGGSYASWKSGFQSAVEFYQSHSDRVLIISSAPGSGNLQKCTDVGLDLRACFGTPQSIENYVKFQKLLSSSMDFEYLNLIDFLCANSICPAVISDTPVYADGNHMSSDFSKMLGQIIKNLNLFD